MRAIAGAPASLAWLDFSREDQQHVCERSSSCSATPTAVTAVTERRRAQWWTSCRLRLQTMAGGGRRLLSTTSVRLRREVQTRWCGAVARPTRPSSAAAGSATPSATLFPGTSVTQTRARVDRGDPAPGDQQPTDASGAASDAGDRDAHPERPQRQWEARVAAWSATLRGFGGASVDAPVDVPVESLEERLDQSAFVLRSQLAPSLDRRPQLIAPGLPLRQRTVNAKRGISRQHSDRRELRAALVTHRPVAEKCW